MYHSTDDGASWKVVNSGLPDPPWAGPIAASSNGYVYTAVGTTVYRSVQPSTAALPKTLVRDYTTQEFHLDQNYPNPFNPSTTVTYELPRTSHVTLTVYDLLGREVTPLVNGVEEPGTHTVQWNASGQASGVYLCRLDAASFTSVRKLLLLR
jgi:hypothetical protein